MSQAECEVVCCICNNTFFAKTKRAKYCSPKCYGVKKRRETCSGEESAASIIRGERIRNEKIRKMKKEVWSLPVAFGGFCGK